jgi:hypothetical protein
MDANDRPEPPKYFIWTRYGEESGALIEDIIAQNGAEQDATGMFHWGIGQSVVNGVDALVAKCEAENVPPRVYFTRMSSQSREIDRNATSGLVLWNSFKDKDGIKPLPDGALVISSGHRQKHYALVCRTDGPLSIDTKHFMIDTQKVRTLPKGAGFSASGTTGVYELCEEINADIKHRSYTVTINAELVAPYHVELYDPLPITTAQRDDVFKIAKLKDTKAWVDAVHTLRAFERSKRA